MTSHAFLGPTRTRIAALALGFFLSFAVGVFAADVDALRDKIDEKTEQIEQIEKEIATYERELQRVGGERQTLENAVAELNLNRKKLLSDISLTEKRIEQTGYSLERLAIAIDDKEQKIQRNTEILANALRTVRESDDRSLVEIILAYDSLSDLSLELDQLDQVQTTVQEELKKLVILKDDLIEQKASQEKEQQNLKGYKTKLGGQKQVVEENKKAKDALLSTTKSQEAAYQQLLDQKLAARRQFESELQEYESQLEYALDPSRLPKEGTGVLGWPMENPEITQGFGLTDFARGGAYGYDKSGKPNPHRGVDFRASVGTPLLAAAPGTVRDAVNMDAYAGCYSYGKWILIDHDNGLSTLYAHLSVMSVSAGEYVKKGQIIGYAGATGYATGPHLHFTVFDREAVKVSPFTWSVGCKQAKIAYAPYEAYLNPLSYLPK